MALFFILNRYSVSFLLMLTATDVMKLDAEPKASINALERWPNDVTEKRVA